MKITIDTKEDSHEEITKVIRLLTHLTGEHKEEIHSNKNIFDDSPTLDLPTSESSQELPVDEPTPPSQQGNVFGNLFENKSSNQSNTQEPTTQIEEDEKTEDIPEVIPY